MISTIILIVGCITFGVTVGYLFAAIARDAKSNAGPSHDDRYRRDRWMRWLDRPQQ
jgi:hypothetical protein